MIGKWFLEPAERGESIKPGRGGDRALITETPGSCGNVFRARGVGERRFECRLELNDPPVETGGFEGDCLTAFFCRLDLNNPPAPQGFAGGISCWSGAG
jgi:hypothetical protein